MIRDRIADSPEPAIVEPPKPVTRNCPACGGEGIILTSRMTMIYRDCRACAGKGVVVR